MQTNISNTPLIPVSIQENISLDEDEDDNEFPDPFELMGSLVVRHLQDLLTWPPAARPSLSPEEMQKCLREKPNPELSDEIVIGLARGLIDSTRISFHLGCSASWIKKYIPPTLKHPYCTIKPSKGYAWLYDPDDVLKELAKNQDLVDKATKLCHGKFEKYTNLCRMQSNINITFGWQFALIKKSMSNIINTFWYDEKNYYNDCPEPNHIFLDMIKVKEYLDRPSPVPNDYAERFLKRYR